MSGKQIRWADHKTNHEPGREKWKHPDSGIAINQIDNTTGGKSFGFSYKVIIPRKLTGAERLRRQFTEFEDASQFVEEILHKKEQGGTLSFALTSEQTTEASNAYQRLKGSGLTLTKAVELGVQLWEKQQTSISLDEAVSRFLNEKVQLGRREKTIKSLKGKLKLLIDCLGGIAVGGISEEELSQMMESNLKHHDPTTWNNYLDDFASFFNWCIKKGYCSANPSKPISKKHKEWEEPCILRIDEVRLLLSKALTGSNTHNSLHIAYHVLQLWVGLRADEVFSKEKECLKWDAINLDRKQVRVDSRIAKKRRLRVLDIPDNAIEWLRLVTQSSGRVIPIARYDLRIAEFRRRCGFAEWATKYKNALRHTFGSMYYALHGEEKTVSALGHKPNDSDVLFSHYRNIVSPEEAKEFFNITPQNLPSPGTL